MSIQYVQGDLFAAPTQALVIPVNCSGVADTGLALQCKQRYPCWFEEYRTICHDHRIWPGCPVLHSLEIATKNQAECYIGANSSCARRLIASGVGAYRASGGGTLTATAVDQWIVDFPTREHWWLSSHLIHIEVGLLNLVTLCHNHRVTSMALPMLGCDDEGLRWEQVQPLLEEHLSPLAIPIYIYI
jgi:O-acetyl-ADP-ribose deacetylase (regulator of RNase III)